MSFKDECAVFGSDPIDLALRFVFHESLQFPDGARL